MAYRRLSREQAEQQTADRIALAQARIEQAVTEIQSGTDWRNYLALQSKLHSYSTGSVELFEVRECPGSGLPIGCVVRPLAAGLGGPSGDGCGVQSEHAGEHGGRDLAAELVGCGQPHATRFYSDLSQSLAKRAGVEVSTGVAAREEPGAGQLLGGAVSSFVG